MMILANSAKKASHSFVNCTALLPNDYTIINSCFRFYQVSQFDLDILSRQLEYCKWSVAILAMSSHTSIYPIVAVTFERVYSIIRPHKAASFNTMKRAKLTIIFIVLIHIIYGLPYLYLTSASGRSCVYFSTRM